MIRNMQEEGAVSSYFSPSIVILHLPMHTLTVFFTFN